MAGFRFVVLLLVVFIHCSIVDSQDDSIKVTFEIMEEVSGTTNLGNIADAANLTSSLDPAYINAMTYSFIPQSVGEIFSMDDQSNLYINSAVDREEECPRMTSQFCNIEFQIFTQSAPSNMNNYYKIVDVEIRILDTNDNYPQFEQDSETVEIQEGLAPNSGRRYRLPAATDLDTGKNNSVQGYMLSPVGTEFSLDVSEDNTEVYLFVRNVSLDREAVDKYTVELLAFDGGSPSLTGTLTVNIIVTDINDNRPTFPQEPYEVTVNEVETEGMVLLSVSATDRDINENGRISYHFKTPSSDPILSSIGLNESSGAIYVTGEFNSAGSPYEVIIEARDHGSPVNVSEPDAKVTITVIDTNANAPEITVQIVTPNGRVMEDQQEGIVVALIGVRDADVGDNAKVSCELYSSEFTLASVSDTQYSVILATALDRESQDTYNITVNCSDKGTPPLNSLKTFTIVVDDVNDNAPEFTETSYSGAIVENNVAGFVILRVSATDNDIDNNALVMYSFLDGNYENLQIEGNSGIIKARNVLDRERNASYTFRVKASDNGNPPKSGVTIVTIQVLDENDNRPVFVGDSYSMQVFENENVSTSAGEVTANDIDLGDNGTVSYMIPAEFSHYPFAILDDGTVVTTEKLDREERSSYDFRVIASDHGQPPKNNTVPVKVLVLDRNDNEPQITFPSDTNRTVYVATVTAVGKVFTRIIASDNDEKDNGRLLYRIVSGNDDALFEMDENTGELRLRKKIQSEKNETHELLISVEDQGEIHHSERTSLEIKTYMQKVNEASVIIPSKGQNILIAIVMSCVTFVLSIIIIIVICVIKRKDRQKHLYNAKAYDQQKIVSSMHRGSNRSSSSKGSEDHMIQPENGYQFKKNKKEVSFSLDEEHEGTVVMSPDLLHGQFDAVSSFKNGNAFSQVNAYEMTPHRQQTPPPPKPERMPSTEDKKQREINRIASLRVQQAIIQTQSNNNNNNKPWPSPPQEELQGRLTRSALEDCHSESSGEITASDSGRGGSEEDIRSSTTHSHDTDELRSPNPSHPFYTSGSQQPTFSSFRGNSVHKTGPILSSFLNREANKRLSPDNLHNSYPMNDLNKDNSRGLPQRQVSVPYQSAHEQKQNNHSSDSLLRTQKHANLNIGNSYEEDSVHGTARDDDDTTTSGSYTINDDNYLATDLNAELNDNMFYKPDTFV